MIRNLILAGLMAIGSWMGLYAQDSINMDTSAFDEYNMLNNVKYAPFTQTYFVYSYVNWLNTPSNLTLKPYNTAYTIQTGLNLLNNKKQHRVNLGTGLSFDFIGLHSDAKRWEFDSAQTLKDTAIDKAFDRSRANFAYIGIPVEFKFLLINKPKNALQLGVGFKAGTLMYSNVRKKLGNVFTKERIREGVNKFNYDVYGYLNYKFIGVYGQYRINSIFNANNAPDTRFWSAGLVLFMKF